MEKIPVLFIVVPCYNEEKVLPVTAPLFLEKLNAMISGGLVDPESRILFVNDGSRDRTWELICEFSASDPHCKGICLSRNHGHQNALLAGLMECREECDITISIDCDGQDDFDAMDEMVKEYRNGCDVVYGVRSSRKTDSFFKRTTASGFYKFMKFMGAEIVYNHADYRLLSARVLREFANFKEVNLFLRGLIPLVGFKSTSVYYERKGRMAGESHYPLRKMLALAFDGVTSLSVKPIRMIMGFGILITFISLIGIIWSIIAALTGNAIAEWASIAGIVCFLGGVQLISMGILGTYISKTYLETKARPRYIISERTDDPK